MIKKLNFLETDEEKRGRLLKVMALRDSGGMVPENFLQVLVILNLNWVRGPMVTNIDSPSILLNRYHHPHHLCLDVSFSLQQQLNETGSQKDLISLAIMAYVPISSFMTNPPHFNTTTSSLQELYKWALESVAVLALNTRLGCLQPDLPKVSDKFHH